ncbi:MAG: ATP-binding protein [Ruminococcus flavefaciens]|nr:ATP-binding protein [Ruminococcus flavefaciens]MCM1228531.1 ATP-binding protein [Ruminococcus flavefaciens]
MSEKLERLALEIESVVIFRGLGKNTFISDLFYLINANPEETAKYMECYSDVAESLYKNGTSNLSEYMLKIVLEDDNLYIRKSANGDEIPQEMTECLINELHIFQELAELTPEDFLDETDYDGFMPRWTNSPVDIAGSYLERLKLVHHYGYGKYAEYSMFIFKNGETVPVKYPDKQRLSELYGYESERKSVIDNTLALVNGKKAQNVLLYGDAGTGKSSTVKAVVNEFADRGLRLVEITKEQLKEIPVLIDELSENPLKFIIFIDDLSFTAGEDCFGALKAVLEGSVASRSDNIAIYATSNRRHLIKESFSDREGDDVHRNDTMQEMLSLSARFGLRVNFSRPDKKNYTAIALEMAKSEGISLSDDEIILKAEQFAISSGNGRSARTAKQFVNQLIMEM